MKAGFGKLGFWVAVILVTVTCAWGQAPARVPTNAEAAQALEVLGTIVPHYEGTVAEINAQRAREIAAFNVLGAFVRAQAQYETVEGSEVANQRGSESEGTKTETKKADGK